MSVTIKAATLERLGACASQVQLFRETFGEAYSADTLEAFTADCVKHANTFAFDWAALKLLKASAWVEYRRVADAADAEYVRVRDAARAEYVRVTATAWAEYVRVSDAALAEYECAKATAFAAAFWEQET